MNTITLLGRIGEDPAMKTLESGATVTEFSLATSERWKDKQGNKQERTEWHRIVFWGKGGEIVNEYFKKGDPIVITGTMTYRKWVDKHDQKRTTAEVKAQSFEFVPSSKGASSSDPVTPAGKAQQRQPEAEASDDIPF